MCRKAKSAQMVHSLREGLGAVGEAVNIRSLPAMQMSVRTYRARPVHRAILMLALTMALAGCGVLERLQSPAAAPPPPPPPARPNAAMSNTSAPPDVATSRTASLPPATRSNTAPATAADLKVVGLTQSETEALLGPPTSTLDRPPAKVWQYRTRDCGVDVYFYLDVGRNDFYALHYDTPIPTSSGAPVGANVNVTDVADRCLRRVYNARRQR
jgi:hypothetical protein